MEPEIEHLIEASWNKLLPAIARDLPDLYPLVFQLHLAVSLDDLDAQQVREFLRELVRTGAI